MSLLTELKQRKVLRVAAAYAVVAWLLIQVISTVAPALQLPDWTVTFTTVLLILGFPVALLLSWTFDVVRTGGTATDAHDGIAVLPFANLSGEAEPGHLVDGIVEDVLTRLQANDSIRVISRQSSFAYKGRSVDAPTIARELRCRYVVEGSVRKVGDRVRVTAQLIDAPTDRHLWAERYDRRLEDAFELQDEICAAVVAAIESRIGSSSPTSVPATDRPPSVAASRRKLLSARWSIPALLALVAMAGFLTWTIQRRGEERWAREDALPRLQALIAADDYVGAFDLAGQIERIAPNDPVLRALRPSFSAAVRLKTAPDGAKVYYRPYAGDEQDWRFLGVAPLVDVAVPIGIGLWRFEKEGRETAVFAMRNPGVQLGNEPFADNRETTAGNDFTIPLTEAATSPKDMVLVPEFVAVITAASEDEPVRLPAFFLDRFEVTNQQFEEFVDASGYSEAAYWQGLPFDDGDWASAVKQFVDLTGRPGPSSWQAGTYPDGTANHPVTGISWYEAAAYCRFRGKELPTAYHWYRASSSVLESWESLSSVIVPASNFAGRGLEPVGKFASLGPYGTYDMAGNAREWLWTEGSAGRWVAGGAFDDPPYLYSEHEEVAPSNRSQSSGVRCMRTAQGGPSSEDLRKPILSTAIDYAALEPVGDAAYAVLAQQLEYPSVPVTPRVVEDSSSNPVWTRQRLEFPTGYDDTTFAVELFLPTGHQPPHQVVFYIPHGGDFFANVTTGGFDPASGGIRFDFLLKSGRALAVLAFDGAFERRWSVARKQSMTRDERLWTLMRHWRQELGRTIDYLATRQDIDAQRLGWFGISYGADGIVPLMAVEKRIGAAVLYSGGGGLYYPSVRTPTVQPLNYFPRVTQPVLMLNGRWDIDSPLVAQQRMFELLGTPADEKKRVLFESGHGNLPRFQVERATLDWYDRYLGPVAK